MRSFVISDDGDTLLAMRIAGIDGVMARERSEILKAVDMVVANEDIGILIISETASRKVSERISAVKLSAKHPLIVEIPSRKGSIKPPDYITSYIRDSIGIKL